MNFYTARVVNKLYVLQMNKDKTRVHYDTKIRMYKDFVEECRKVVEANDRLEVNA